MAETVTLDRRETEKYIKLGRQWENLCVLLTGDPAFNFLLNK